MDGFNDKATLGVKETVSETGSSSEGKEGTQVKPENRIFHPDQVSGFEAHHGTLERVKVLINKIKVKQCFTDLDRT